MTPLELAAMVDRLTPQLSDGTVETANQAIALVPALMAENQRIRHELETWRDDMRRSATVQYPLAQFQTVPFISVMEQHADKITRILDQEDTDD